jgi:hypothetical protein
MAQVKAEILCNNIYLNGRKCLKGEVESIDSGLADMVLAGDTEAGRDPRIKVTKTRKRRTKAEMEVTNGDDS